MNKPAYEKVAAILAGELTLARHDFSAKRMRTVVNIALSLADVFAQDNKLFDRAKFYEQVGMDSSTFGTE